MYCSRYEQDYYVSDTKAKLPIRWMSWENLLLVSTKNFSLINYGYQTSSIKNINL